MLQALQNRLRSGDLAGLKGTDLAIEIPLSLPLVNEILAARPDSPVEELRVLSMDQNEAVLRLIIDAPVVGAQRRDLRLRLRGTVSPPDQEWLFFDILSGLKFLDKPLLSFIGSTLADKLPGGVKVSSDGIALHLPSWLKNAGQGGLLPALAAFELASSEDRLFIRIHLQVAA